MDNPIIILGGNSLKYIARASLLIHDAQWELDYNLVTVKPDVVTYFANKYLVQNYAHKSPHWD